MPESYRRIPESYRRIMVYGVTGSGKSTLAVRLGEALGIPYVSIDDLTWLPGWVLLAKADQRKLIAEVCAGDSWVIDHGYGTWLDIPLGRADLIVGLDYPRWLSLSRLVRRSLRNVLTRRPTCNGNVETWRQLLSRDSIVAWHFRSFARKRARLRGWELQSPGPTVLRFTSPRQAERWLAELHRPAGTPPSPN